MSPGRCYIDFETRSYSDLGEVGAWVYSEHETTDVICLCYRIRHPGEDRSTEPVKSWVFGRDGSTMPGDLRRAIRDGYEVEAHNYSFELAIWQNVMVRKYGWVEIKPEQWRDTMSVACYMAMPAKLDSLLRALSMPGKNPKGSRLISKYSKLYLKTSEPVIPPEAMEEWIEYCSDDVRMEEAVSDYLGDLPEREEDVFLMDQEINLRGIKLDLKGIEVATAVVEKRATELIERFRTITGNGCADLGLNPTQRDKVLVWCAEQGVKLDNMRAAYLEDLLEEEGELPQGIVRDALTIRLAVNKASTKKLAAMARQAGRDGRARWQQRYHGAQTGRQTGSGFQPLNLNRGMEDVDPEQLVRDIMHGDPKWLDCLYGDATDAVAKASRHWIVAEEGHQIYAGDFVSIEAVILACLAGETWKIEAFREKKPIYEMMADRIYGLPEGTVTKKTHPKERQDGKTGELAFGYGGGLNAWLKFDNSGRHSDERIEEIKEAWRDAHPMVAGVQLYYANSGYVQDDIEKGSRRSGRVGGLWRGLEDAALGAMTIPTQTTSYGEIGFQCVDEWLSMILPNGKRIWYREPRLEVQMPQWHRPETKPECADRSCSCQPKPTITYMAQKTGQWQRVTTYGGKLAENACQATSREFLIPSMRNLRRHGYPIILSVYDEIVCEVRDGVGSRSEFEDILMDVPDRGWAASWPIRVEVGPPMARYRK